jgi:hypothetical protein
MYSSVMIRIKNIREKREKMEKQAYLNPDNDCMVLVLELIDPNHSTENV